MEEWTVGDIALIWISLFLGWMGIFTVFLIVDELIKLARGKK